MASAPQPQSNADQISTIEELKERLANQRRNRTAAATKLRECAAEAAEGTPADSAVFYVEKPEEQAPGASGVRQLPGEEAVAARRQQLLAERQKRGEAINRLKKTSFQVVQRLRPTEYLDPEKVRRALMDKPADDAPTHVNGAETKINGAHHNNGANG